MSRIASLKVEALADRKAIRITATSPIASGTMTLPLSAAAFYHGMRQWDAGVLIQDAFPTLSAEEREFLISGLTPEAWARVFPKGSQD